MTQRNGTEHLNSVFDLNSIASSQRPRSIVEFEEAEYDFFMNDL